MFESQTFSVIREGLRLEKVAGGRKETELMRFRHRVFREQLRWLAESTDGLDRDDYDPFSDNFAVLDKNMVVGSVRLTPGQCPFMIEREFSALLPDGWTLHKGQGSAEITRMAVEMKGQRARSDSASHLLYFMLYQWALHHGVRWMYFVVEPPFFRHICRLGFPAFAIGPARPLDGGVMSQAAYLDWDKADPAFIRWLRAGVSIPAAVPAQSREFDYLH
jgi:N-acyl-L-homoserine lactone synthetase